MFPGLPGGRRAALALALLLALLLSSVPRIGGAAAAAEAARPNPFAGTRLDPAARGTSAAIDGLRAASSDADFSSYIQSQPTAVWLTDLADWNACCGGVQGYVNKVVTQSLAQQTTPVLVLYYIPNRDCNGLSSGGAPTEAAYNTWVDLVVRGINNRKAVVLVEPDALSTDCATGAGRARTIATAVGKLKANPNAYVYIDGGHNDYATVPAMVARLQDAGVAQADGFALNVALYQYTTAEVAYGRAIAQALAAQGIPGKRFVVDTGRNGLGPLPDSFDNQWCTPPLRALGVEPTIATGDPLAVAFLWVKTVWQADGDCGRGGNEPGAGQAYWSYATMLAHNAQQPFRDWDQLSPAAQPVVRQLARLGAIRGNGDGNPAKGLLPTFGATATTKRAQMAALLARPAFWDFDTWGDKDFGDQSGVDGALWQNVRTLAHYNVARGYADGTFRPLDPVLYQQVLLFISRSMQTRGCWQLAPDDLTIFPNLPADSAAAVADRRDLVTFVNYTQNFGGVPDHHPQVSFADFDQPASREWFARALYAALASCTPPAIDYAPAP